MSSNPVEASLLLGLTFACTKIALFIPFIHLIGAQFNIWIILHLALTVLLKVIRIRTYFVDCLLTFEGIIAFQRHNLIPCQERQ